MLGDRTHIQGELNSDKILRCPAQRDEDARPGAESNAATNGAKQIGGQGGGAQEKQSPNQRKMLLKMMNLK